MVGHLISGGDILVIHVVHVSVIKSRHLELGDWWCFLVWSLVEWALGSLLAVAQACQFVDWMKSAWGSVLGTLCIDGVMRWQSDTGKTSELRSNSL